MLYFTGGSISTAPILRSLRYQQCAAKNIDGFYNARNGVYRKEPSASDRVGPVFENALDHYGATIVRDVGTIARNGAMCQYPGDESITKE